MKKIKANFFIPTIVYVLLIGLIIRLMLSAFGTLHLDQGTFIAWAASLASHGFKNFYSGWSDYLPGYLYFLWGLGKINLLNIIPPEILFKIPAILADIATGFLIYKILSKYKNEKWGIIGAAIYIFNPAILANSTFWGQVDSLTALCALFSIYLISAPAAGQTSSIFWSAAILSFGTLIKPQTAFIFPVIIFLMIKNKWDFKKIFAYLIIGLSVFIIGFIPFSNGNLISFILQRLTLSANQYSYTSVNAFNFWGLFGFWKEDNIVIQFGGYILVLISAIFLLIKSSKNKLSPYYISAFIFAASFMFFTRMHERHLLPVFAPLAIVLVENPLFLIPYAGFSLIYILNLFYSFNWITSNFEQMLPDVVVKFLSASGVIFIIFIFYAILRNLKSSWAKVFLKFREFFQKIGERKAVTKNNFPKINLSPKTSQAILYAILVFAFISRTFYLWSPQTMYFDEVYHAFTAKVMMGVDRAKAWEWWNTPPEGFAYEWTHPPLAKLGMVAGMSIFGQNSFGWRVPGALLGVGSVFLVYLLAKILFKDEALGLLAAGVFSLDGLPLVLSRIGMNDSYVLFFSLLSIYLFIKASGPEGHSARWDLFSAASFGLALSSKWSALWAAPIIFLLWLKRKKKFKFSILWFLILPLAIYLLSYLPMFFTGHDLTIWWGMQKQMWWYHTGLRATHPYTSPWWSWPLLLRPIYLYTNEEAGGMVSRIYAMGNPFVFWSGIIAVGLSAIFAYIEKNKNLGLIVFSYLIFFVPWAASPRIMFLYHYLPSIPFMSIAIAYVLRRLPKFMFTYLLICLFAYLYFYPHWAGLSIPLWLDKSYYWFGSWR